MSTGRGETPQGGQFNQHGWHCNAAPIPCSSNMPLLPLPLRQCRFGLRQPEGHVHSAIHLDSGGERGAGQCSTVCLAVERAETVVTVRLQRAHAEVFGQGEGVLIVDHGWLAIRRLTPCCDVAEQAQGIGLVTAFLVLTSERQRTHCDRP